MLEPPEFGLDPRVAETGSPPCPEAPEVRVVDHAPCATGSPGKAGVSLAESRVLLRFVRGGKGRQPASGCSER